MHKEGAAHRRTQHRRQLVVRDDEDDDWDDGDDQGAGSGEAWQEGDEEADEEVEGGEERTVTMLYRY